MRGLLVVVAMGLGQAKVRQRYGHLCGVKYAAARWRYTELLTDARVENNNNKIKIFDFLIKSEYLFIRTVVFDCLLSVLF